MNSQQTPHPSQLKAFLHQDDEELCEILDHSISDTLEHKYELGSNIPILSWHSIVLFVHTRPTIALGVSHEIVVPLQDKTLPVRLTNVSCRDQGFLVTGELHE